MEALRLISIIVSRYRRLTFYPGPDWCGAGRVNYGVRPSLRNTEINFDGLFYHYADPPGTVTAQFASGESVTVYIADEERIHAVIRDRKGRVIKTREDVRKVQVPNVGICLK